MKAHFYLSPLDHPLHSAVIQQPMRLLSLFEHPDVQQNDIEWLKDNAAIALDGEVIPPDRWQHIIVKPSPKHELNIVVMPKGKKVFAILAAVAAVALTAGIAAFGIPFLGAGFAAGTLGANLVAAGVGLAGSLLVSSLTAPPQIGNNSDERPTTNAGVGGNSATLLDVLPGVVGKIGTSPPFLMPPYTTWDGDNLTINAAVGLQGRCLIEGLKINGIPIDDIAGISYETREGRLGDDPRTMFLKTVVEERDSVTLSNFITELESNTNDLLVDQTTPDNSAPQWHYFRSAGKFTELNFRFLFPSGIVYTPDATEAVVPVRIEMRKVGDSSWRKLPTFHFADYRAGSGPMRAEIRIERRNPPGGIHWSTAIDELPVCNVMNITNIGDTPYESDTYFQEDNVFGITGIRAIQRALFTSATNSEGYTISASSTNGTDSPWKSSSSTDIFTPYWRPTDGTIGTGCYLQWDCPSPTTFRSYYLSSGASPAGVQNFTPTKWRVLGSNDNWATSTQLDDEDIDTSKKPTYRGDYQIGNPGAYSSYRWVFLGVVSGTQLRVGRLNPNTGDAVGCVFNDPQGIAPGTLSFHSSSYNKTACKYVTLDKRGARVFLKPGDWSEGEYEIRVKRGIAFYEPFFNPYHASGANLTPYAYNSSTGTASHYFDYFNSSGYKIYIGQRLYRSDCTIEAFQTIDGDESPFDDSGIAMIALSAPNIQINSIYAEFTKYASIYDATIWQATKIPTQNAAAHYRDLLLGEGNSDPVGGEVLDEEGLAEWYLQGYNVNAILQGVRVNEVKQVIATAGYASPRDSRVYGVVRDLDTSSDPIRYLIAPYNSKSEGNISEIRKLPHAIRAEFNNEALSYAVDHVIVYRPGYDASNATLFETINYTGITTEAEVTARATFDLRQSYLRQARYSREVGLEFLGIQRGDVVGLSDDTIDGNTAGGWIKSVQYSGSNIVSVTLDSIMPWSLSTSIESAEDVASLTDIVNPAEPMALAIKIPGQDLIYKQVSTVTDDNVCTFTTPFADDGSIVPGLLAVCGTYDRPVRRCRVLQVIPRGYERRLVIMTDEAPELYA